MYAKRIIRFLSPSLCLTLSLFPTVAMLELRIARLKKLAEIGKYFRSQFGFKSSRYEGAPLSLLISSCSLE